MVNRHISQAMAMGIDTHQEPVVYMQENCHICRAGGFNANTRLSISTGTEQLIVTLNVVRNDQLSAINGTNWTLQNGSATAEYQRR